MRPRPQNARKRSGLVGFLLLALALRALIPAGFMPSPDHAFGFEICPDGLPASLATTWAPSSGAHSAHHHHMAGADSAAAGHADGHGHSNAHADHCLFAVGAAAPAPHVAPAVIPGGAFAAPNGAPAALALDDSRYRVQQPRGPPALA
jgi:hypothetical protein